MRNCLSVAIIHADPVLYNTISTSTRPTSILQYFIAHQRGNENLDVAYAAPRRHRQRDNYQAPATVINLWFIDVPSENIFHNVYSVAWLGLAWRFPFKGNVGLRKSRERRGIVPVVVGLEKISGSTSGVRLVRKNPSRD